MPALAAAHRHNVLFLNGWLVVCGIALALVEPGRGYVLAAALGGAIILLLGLLGWTLAIARAQGKRRQLRRGQVRAVYALATLALLAYPALLTIYFLAPPTGLPPTAGILVAGALYLFVCAAYVHLFIVKLIRSADDQRARAHRRQVDARWMRELLRADRRPAASKQG